MEKSVTIHIEGMEAVGTDAPTVEDFLAQVSDVLALFEGVDETLSEGEGQHIVWRVTNAKMNSPLAIEITPFPRNFAETIDNRARRVVEIVSSGIRKVSTSGLPPPTFDKKLAAKAEALIRRVANGLLRTDLQFAEDYDIEPLRLDRSTAYGFLRASELAKESEFSPYRELGSIEGFISKVELDGYGRPVVWLRSRIDGAAVKCVSSENGLARIGHFEVSEVIRGLRVQMFGVINYRNNSKINYVDVTHVLVFPPDKDLPDEASIVAPGFIGQQLAEQYLERLREDD